jgi:hypothetical protein
VKTKALVAGLRSVATQRAGVWILAVASLMVLILPTLIWLGSGFVLSRPALVVSQGLSQEDSGYFKDKSVAIYTQILEFDPENRRAKVAYFPWPTDDFAKQFSSSVMMSVPLRFFADGTDAMVVGYEAGEQVGGIEVTVDVLSTDAGELANDNSYPFDRYVLDGYAQVEIRESGSYVPVQAFDYFYSTPLPDFDIEYSRLASFDQPLGSAPPIRDATAILAERQQGKISYTATLSRPEAARNMALAIYAFALISALSLLLLTVQVLRGARTVQLGALIWSAATVLGVIQIRSLAPGSPRMGVLLDHLVLLPSLIVTTTCTVAIVFFWAFTKKTGYGSEGAGESMPEF